MPLCCRPSFARPGPAAAAATAFLSDCLSACPVSSSKRGSLDGVGGGSSVGPHKFAPPDATTSSRPHATSMSRDVTGSFLQVLTLRLPEKCVLVV